MVLEESVDDGKLQTEVNRDRHLRSIGRGKKIVMVGMVESLGADRAIDHHRFHSQIAEPRDFLRGALGIL